MNEQASAAMEQPGRRPGSPLDPFIAAAFWTLAAIILINLRGLYLPGDNRALLFAVLRVVCCLLLIGLVHVRLPQALGKSGVWLLGSMASYLMIGFFVSVTTGAEILVELYGFNLYVYVTKTAISIVLVLGAALGGYAILERVGMQAFLKSVMLVLTASSASIVFTHVLRSMGVLPTLEVIVDAGLYNVDVYRLSGAFWESNSPGFIGCMTAALALAFLGNVRRPVLAYPALTVGLLAAFGSLSKTAIISMGVVLVFFLLLNGRGGRSPILFCVGALTLMSAIYVQKADLFRFSRLEETGAVPFAELNRLHHIGALLTGDFSDGTASSRPMLWKLGLRQSLESPIVGQGLGRFSLMDRAFFSERQEVLTGVHNVYLLLLGEAGIVPLSLYLLYLFSLLRLRWAVPKSLARDAIVGWTILVVLQGMAFHQLFELGMYSFLGGVTCAVASYAARGSGGRTLETPPILARTNAAPSATG